MTHSCKLYPEKEMRALDKTKRIYEIYLIIK